MDELHGLTLRDCAEVMAQDTALRAQHGEPAHKPHLRRWLAERGWSEEQWAMAWNAWWSKAEADPTGKLHADLAVHQQQFALAAHHADVPDASGDAKEGVTLDLYAQLMAKAAGGADMEATVAEAGLDWSQWQRAQTAWNLAMSQDVDHHLTTQYGMLYAKHTPGFQEQMHAQTAAIMAARHVAGDDDDEPEKEYTFADMVGELEDASPGTRWSAAHHVANEWDLGERGDAALDRAGRRAVELALECLRSFDDDTVSEAEALGRDLQMFAGEGFFTAAQAVEAKGALETGLSRARAALAGHEEALAPIRDKAVPERVRMQSAVQDHTSLVEELESFVEDWDDNLAEPTDESEPVVKTASASASASSVSPSTTVPAKAEEGLIGVLKGLPVVGDILRMLGM